MKRLNFFLIFVIIVTGFSAHSEKAFATSYPSALVWNNFIYILSNEEIDIEEIGNEVGKIKRLNTPMPKKNGESNDKPVGSLLFEIKGRNTQDVIAVKVNDTFFKASKHGPAQDTTNVLELSKEQTWLVSLTVICFLVLLTIWRIKQRHID